jgi:hypothetical protein
VQFSGDAIAAELKQASLLAFENLRLKGVCGLGFCAGDGGFVWKGRWLRERIGFAVGSALGCRG